MVVEKRFGNTLGYRIHIFFAALIAEKKVLIKQAVPVDDAWATSSGNT